MIDKFGKIILSMVALLVFQAYLYVSEPPTSDVYFILITIFASLVGLSLSLTLNHNIVPVVKSFASFLKRKLHIDSNKSKMLKSNSSREASFDDTLSLESEREYSVLTISLTAFICLNAVFALIYM